MNGCCTIVIPEYLSMKNVDKLYCAVLPSQEICCVIFDFSRINFVTPHSLILIVTASRFYKDRFNRVVEWKNIKPAVLGYLDRMNIRELDFIRIERPSIFRRRNYQESDARVDLSIIENADQLGSAILQTKKVLDHWFPENQECKRHLLTLIKETVENSIEHSSVESSKGFCYYVLQKYAYNDGSTEVQIAVGDVGVGMLVSQRRVHPLTKNDAQALVQAVMRGRSGRKSGGGMGYINVRESLAPLHGEIYIRSGRAHIEYAVGMSGERIYRYPYSCPGTQIVFKCRA